MWPKAIVWRVPPQTSPEVKGSGELEKAIIMQFDIVPTKDLMTMIQI